MYVDYWAQEAKLDFEQSKHEQKDKDRIKNGVQIMVWQLPYFSDSKISL